MKSIDTDEDYKEYIKTLPFDGLLDIERNINKSMYPERHRLVTDLIEEYRRNNNYTYSKAYLDNLRYPDGVRFIRSMNVLILILAIAAIIIKAGNGTIRLNLEIILLAVLGVAFSSIVIYGLFREKAWVVIMILLSSYLNLLRLVLTFFAKQGESMDRLITSGFIIAFVGFYAYQIVVFSRKETRDFYKDKGVVLVQY